MIGRRCTIEGLTNRTARSARLLELPEYLHKESLFFVQNSDPLSEDNEQG